MMVRRSFSGLAIGLVIGAIAAAVAWKMRLDDERWWMGGVGGLGLVVAGVVGWRRRWSDTQVALYLDGRWGTNETITTAVQMRDTTIPSNNNASNREKSAIKSTDGETPANEHNDVRSVVMTQAIDALKKGSPKRTGPRLWRFEHALIPVGAAAVVLVSVIELPAKVQPIAQPGEQQVRIENLQTLAPVIALGQLKTPDPERQKQLEQIANDAKKLQQDLEKGMELRQAQAEIARLRDAVSAQRAQMSSSKQRAGLEAAHGRLAENKQLKSAADALVDRDLTRFDEEMQRLANQRERSDRDAAQQALEEAAQRADKLGAKDVAKFLEEQKRLLQERQKRAEALRQFADAFGPDLPPDIKEKLDQFEQQGTDNSAGELAEKMADALKNLTPEQRKQLAENMKKRLQNQQGTQQQNPSDPMSQEQIEQMLDMLSTPQGQRQLEQMLRDMADNPPQSEQLEQDKSLGDAEKGLGEAQEQLGAPMPIPLPVPSGQQPGQQGQQGQSGQQGQQGQSGQQGQPGQQGQQGQTPGSSSSVGSDPQAQSGSPESSGSTGTGSGGKADHTGQTPSVETEEFRARVGGKINPGAPMSGVATGRGKGQVGETANVRGMEGVGQAAPGEIGGAERSEIPQEYREQIGRYFQP